METVLKLNIAKLDAILLNTIKKAFGKDHSIEISIKKEKTKTGSMRPETREEYFARLRKAIKDVETRNVISFTGEEFETLSKKLLNKK